MAGIKSSWVEHHVSGQVADEDAHEEVGREQPVLAGLNRFLRAVHRHSERNFFPDARFKRVIHRLLRRRKLRRTHSRW